MVDCDVCGKQIGSIEEPMFVDSGDNVVCRTCYKESEGGDPDPGDAEFDAEDVSEEQSKEYFSKLDPRV